MRTVSDGTSTECVPSSQLIVYIPFGCTRVTIPEYSVPSYTPVTRDPWNGCPSVLPLVPVYVGLVYVAGATGAGVTARSIRPAAG